MQKPLKYHTMMLRAIDDVPGQANKVLNDLLLKGWVVEQMTALPLNALNHGQTIGDRYIVYLLAYYGKESE